MFKVDGDFKFAKIWGCGKNYLLAGLDLQCGIFDNIWMVDVANPKDENLQKPVDIQPAFTQASTCLSHIVYTAKSEPHSLLNR
jgi:hypothetical protein